MQPLKRHPTAKATSLIIALALIFSPALMAQVFSLQLNTTSDYTNFVHNYTNTHGNYTYIEKPIFPVLVNDSQIPVGENWTIIVPLQSNHNYHIYCYGAWINTSSQAKTDYDFYIYDTQGNLVSSHTESAGFPPHLGTTTDDALFTPTESGNYSFVISNNPFDSSGAQQATFMIVENLENNKWFTEYLEGNSDTNSSLYKTWAYEFETNASYIELYIDVPQTLDVYEARLYLMNSLNSPSLNSFPLPWEPGLYGNLTGSVGGYNFEPNGYRGVAYTSEEYPGQPMFLNYTSPNTGPNLYQLVLIGQQGSGNIELMMKTQFGNISLTPQTLLSRVYPGKPAVISFTTNNTLNEAMLSYSTDNWADITTMDMELTNQTCNATLPGQEAGTLVQYKIEARDILKNNLEAQGNYTVKEPLTLNITVAKDKIPFGQNITVNGVLSPNYQNSTIEVQFTSTNSVQNISSPVSSNGNFTATLKPNAPGLWSVTATSPETQTTYRSDSQQLTVTVAEPPIYIKYSLFFIVGFVGVIAAGGIVYFLKFRGR